MMYALAYVPVAYLLAALCAGDVSRMVLSLWTMMSFVLLSACNKMLDDKKAWFRMERNGQHIADLDTDADHYQLFTDILCLSFFGVLAVFCYVHVGQATLLRNPFKLILSPTDRIHLCDVILLAISILCLRNVVHAGVTAIPVRPMIAIAFGGGILNWPPEMRLFRIMSAVGMVGGIIACLLTMESCDEYFVALTAYKSQCEQETFLFQVLLIVLSLAAFARVY